MVQVRAAQGGVAKADWASFEQASGPLAASWEQKIGAGLWAAGRGSRLGSWRLRSTPNLSDALSPFSSMVVEDPTGTVDCCR